MNLNTPPHPEPEPSDSIDLVLRHVSRLFPDQLARALLPSGSEIASAT